MTTTSPTTRPTFGVAVPFSAHHLDYDAVCEFARRAHNSGFDGLWLSDHLVVGPPPESSRTWYDAPTLLAGLAGLVPGMTVGTDVLIVSHRHPVIAAKALATLDVITGGRLVVGVGSGHSAHEFGVLGAEFEKRAPVIDEYLQVWRAVWGPGPTNFDGEHVSIDEPELFPKPVQRPHPPIWVGGNSRAAIRRAANLGDGWHPLGIPFAVYAEGATLLRDLAEQAGRPTPTLSYSGFFGRIGAESVNDATRVPLTGGVEQVLDDIGRLTEIGVRNFVFRLGSPELSNAEVLEQVEVVAAEVLPRAST